MLPGISNVVDILFGAFGELGNWNVFVVEENWFCNLFLVTGFSKFEFNIELVEFAEFSLSFCGVFVEFCWVKGRFS